MAAESITLSCRYSRMVNLSEGYTIQDTENESDGRGDLSYSMSLTADSLGRNLDLSITKNHNLNQLSPR